VSDDNGAASQESVVAGLGITAREALGAGADSGVPRAGTGIPGLDQLTLGGLPRGQTTVVSGSTGSGKTILAAQFLAEGIRNGEPGVFVTFEEPAEHLRRNLSSVGWDIPAWEAEGLWRFVDGSPVEVGDDADGYRFETLLAQIGHAVDHTAADRIVLDSLNVVLALVDGPGAVRHHMRRLAAELRRMGLTVVMTLGSQGDREEIVTPEGFEHFVADHVIVLRNALQNEKRRRTLEVLKMRGAMHRKGEYPFTILPGQGLVVIPLSVIQLTQRSSATRTSSGNPDLDALCDGGFLRDSVVLVAGATGTGKTLLATEFLAGAGRGTDERALLFAFEESRDQIFRNAAGWGHDFDELERQGRLRVVATYPETASLEDHLVEISREIETFRPTRVAIDSITALERSGTTRGFREFMIVLTSYVKAQQLAVLLTVNSSMTLPGSSVTDSHISTLTDSIVLLHYVEVDGAVRRGLTVLKMRGSAHDNRIHEFSIDDSGMQIGAPFRGVGGILAGSPFPQGGT
jgi:circadian clock protein KaiC